MILSNTIHTSHRYTFTDLMHLSCPETCRHYKNYYLDIIVVNLYVTNSFCLMSGINVARTWQISYSNKCAAKGSFSILEVKGVIYQHRDISSTMQNFADLHWLPVRARINSQIAFLTFKTLTIE